MIRNGDADISMLKEGSTRGEYAAYIKSTLGNIMYGKEDSKWAYVIEGEVEK